MVKYKILNDFEPFCLMEEHFFGVNSQKNTLKDFSLVWDMLKGNGCQIDTKVDIHNKLLWAIIIYWIVFCEINLNWKGKEENF
jgi:hypothetical protein